MTKSSTQVSWAQPSESTGPALADDVVLEATVLRKPIRGRVGVEAVMAAAAAYYTRLSFTHQATSGARTYLEWEAAAPNGAEMSGITVLTRTPDGLVEQVAIHHRPLDAALEFSRAVGRRTAGVVAPGSFAD
ncbi:hypothetical protein [Amycolatopsis sp. NPDC098790]|uniref:hypothetical protein n=1 Tax=Amycolatopsis sp. NPDC098790 TaxID=3363939 RepID=UPI0038251CA3